MVNRTGRLKAGDVIRSMGVRSVIITLVTFFAMLTVTCVVGLQFYNSAKKNIHLQGKVNAVQAAKEFDKYILVRKNTVILASHVVDDMIGEGKPNSEILEYLMAESLSIKKSIDKDYTGLYGWINGAYCDGDGWVPDDDYVATERPWYLETIADDSEITFVRPYADEQTKSVLTTVAKRLSDGVSVIALDVTLSRIQEITEAIAEETPGNYGIVLDETGQVIAHSDRDELGKNYREESGTLGAALAASLYSEGSREFELSFENQKYTVFTEPLEGDWLSVSFISNKRFYRPLMMVLTLMIAFTLLEIVVYIIVIYNQSAKNLAIATAKEAQSASRAKTLFLSRMSHEIRTPINAIIGLDSIALRDENISPHTRDELDKIGASARHLLSIVNDILDMSRIEAGHMELKEEVFFFAEFLQQICVIVGGQCEDKGLRFVCDRAEALEDLYVGDSLKLKQVLINILGNAVKFTDAPGTITLAIEQTARAEDRATLCFTMSDTGIGMDRAYIPKLFDAFSQEDTANTTRYGGSGLGLAITRSFVELMGGEIDVESEKGVGTTFRVTVALGRVRASALPKAEAEASKPDGIALAGRHVLIAEDQEMNAEVLADLLELEGVTSEWAENGKRAVEMFKQNEPGHFDAILMDMRMPVMDGLAATRALRSLNRDDAADIPIIALSANAFDEDVRQCIESGMNVHLSKPVDIERLKEALGALTVVVTEPSPRPSAPPP